MAQLFFLCMPTNVNERERDSIKLSSQLGKKGEEKKDAWKKRAGNFLSLSLTKHFSSLRQGRFFLFCDDGWPQKVYLQSSVASKLLFCQEIWLSLSLSPSFPDLSWSDGRREKKKKKLVRSFSCPEKDFISQLFFLPKKYFPPKY